MRKSIKIALFALLVFMGASFFPKSERSLRNSVVQLTAAEGSCSGEQVRAPSGKTYILTAAHCSILIHDNKIMVTTEDGRKLLRAVIAEDPKSDLLLLDSVPGLPALDIARYYWRGVHVRTFTHGMGHATYKTEGELMELTAITVPLQIVFDGEQPLMKCDQPKNVLIHADTIFGKASGCFLVVDEVTTSAMIVPGSSGGMVVNDSGELVGVVSAGDGHFGYLVPLTDIQRFLNSY